MTQRTATMTPCSAQNALDRAVDKRWNVEFYAEDGILVRVIPFITSAEAHRRVQSWEG